MEKQKIMERVEKTESCWLWKGSLNNHGYGRFKKNGKVVLAHRYFWQMHNGDIPDGMFILHKCDVPNCVNPDHLFVGTQQDNMLDMKNKKRSSRGERHRLSKLTYEKAEQIRRSYRPATHARTRQENSIRWLAEKYGVSSKTIQRVINRETWIS